MNLTSPDFKGSTFEPARDGARLQSQLDRVHEAMKRADWWVTLSYLSAVTGSPEASCSARLRDLRRMGYEIQRRYESRGLWAYRLVGQTELAL